MALEEQRQEQDPGDLETGSLRSRNEVLSTRTRLLAVWLETMNGDLGRTDQLDMGQEGVGTQL